MSQQDQNKFLEEAEASCPLCGDQAVYYQSYRGLDYFKCKHCQGVFMDTDQRLSPLVEKSRYDFHQNIVTDPGYQAFVRPVVEAITAEYPLGAQGLDYGCGPGPVISFMLAKQGYEPLLYDPYYYPDTSYLNLTYDYIILSEVAEHFYEPGKEFRKLRSLMRPGASIYIKTSLISAETDFQKWSYKNDDTHVFFYSKASFAWLMEQMDFDCIDFYPTYLRLKLA